VSEAIDNMMAAAVEHALATYVASADACGDVADGGAAEGESRAEREARQKYERIAEIVAAQNAPNYGKTGKLLLSNTQKLRNKLHRNYVLMQEHARRLQQLQPGQLPADVVSNTKQMLADRHYVLYMPGDKRYTRPCTLDELRTQPNVAVDVGSHSVYNKTLRQWKVALFCVRIVARATYPRAIGYYAQTDARASAHGGAGGGGDDDDTNEPARHAGRKRARSSTSSVASAAATDMLAARHCEDPNRKRRRQNFERARALEPVHEPKTGPENASGGDDETRRTDAAGTAPTASDEPSQNASSSSDARTACCETDLKLAQGRETYADGWDVADEKKRRRTEAAVEAKSDTNPLKLICILHDRDSGALGVGHIRMYFAWLSTQRISRVVFLMERGLTSQAMVEAQRLVDTMPWSIECEFFLFSDLSFLAKDHELVPLHETVPGDEVEELLADLRVDPARLPKIRLAQDPIAKYYGNRARDILRITSLSAMAGSVVSYCRVV
jgi:DNA-directed RNA polymerase subunit H